MPTNCLKSKSQSVSQLVSEWQGHLLSCPGQLKMIKICLVLFWFCPPQSGAPNFRPPGRQTQTQVRNFNAISRSPAGFVKVPFVSPAPLQATPKGEKNYSVLRCSVLKKVCFLHTVLWTCVFAPVFLAFLAAVFSKLPISPFPPRPSAPSRQVGGGDP